MTNFVAAKRVNDIRVSPTTVAAQMARDLKAVGKDILDLTIGEPDFDTPAAIKDEAIRAIHAGMTKYTPVNGTPELRQAIQGDFRDRHGIDAPLDAICVGGGGKQILFLALMASVEDGAEVIVPAPYWVSYPDMVIANGGAPVIVPCPEVAGFKLTPEALERAITPRTRWVILNSPSNPTGVAYTPDELKALGAVLARHPGVWVLCDEIYDRIWYADFPATSLVEACPELAGRTLVVNGVSKSHAMTGWRIGYGVGPKPLIDAINKLQSQMSSCPSSISQAAAAVALSGDQAEVEGQVQIYRQRSDRAVERINAIPGLSCVKPDGAFYLYVNCEALIGRKTPAGKVIGNDQDLVIYLLDTAGVATVQGAAYGLEPYFRISTATSIDVIDAACDRIEDACRKLL